MPDLRSDSSYFSQGNKAKLFLREENSYGELYAAAKTAEDFLINEPLGLVPGSVITEDRAYIQPDILTGSPSRVEGELGKSVVGGTYAFFLAHPYSKTGSFAPDYLTTTHLLNHAVGTTIKMGEVEPSASVSTVIDGKKYKVVTVGDFPLTGTSSWNGIGAGSTPTAGDIFIALTDGPASQFEGSPIPGKVSLIETESVLDQDLPTNGLGFLQIIENGTTDNYAAYFSGIRVNGTTITAPSNDTAVNIAFDFMGRRGEFFIANSTTLENDLSNWDLGFGNKAVPNYFPSWSTEVTLTKDSTDFNFAFSNLRLNINNNLSPISFIDSTNYVKDFQRGQRAVNGSFTLPLYYKNSSSNTTQFLTDFFNKQNFSMAIKFNAEGNNEFIEFIFPNVVLSSAPVPRNINQSNVDIEINFVAYPEKSNTEFKKNSEFKIRIVPQ